MSSFFEEAKSDFWELHSAAAGLSQCERSGHPVGPEVHIGSAGVPDGRILEGTSVKLVRLSLREHGDALWDRAGGLAHEALWTYLGEGPFNSREEFDALLLKREQSSDPFFYGVIDLQSGRALGVAALMRIEPLHRVIEIGNILFTEPLQRTRAATEAIYLLSRHVFEDLGYRRYEWKCNALNEPSRRAALRFGFTFEGIFRQHMIIKGRSRDTAWYSMLDGEWPERAAEFERWLQPSNFDVTGKQVSALAHNLV